MKVKNILVSQPKPQTDKSPYFDLAKKYNLKIDFQPFINIEGIDVRDFKATKISILDHSGVIFTSRTAIDHYFRISQEMKLTIPDEMKYFCISESTAFYLQKYIVYRKRKIFFGNGKFDKLIELIKKNKDLKFLVPLSDIHKQTIPESLENNKITFTKAILYKTVSSDLSDLLDVNYDILVFFSPSGITSLFQNFPDFEQKNTKIAAFGPTTAKSVEDAGLTLDIKAPSPKSPSMTMALEEYIKNTK